MATELTTLQFLTGGKKYNFIAAIRNYNDEQALNIDAALVDTFEYVNELNKLYPTGSLVYVDPVGKLINYLHSPYLILDVHIAELSKNDNTESRFYIFDEAENKKFTLTFLVTNIEILKRDKETVTYKLHFVGINYLLLSCPIEYSNYNSEKLPIVTLIKNCLINNDQENKLIHIAESFDKNADDVKIYYASKENDTAITAIDYLLNKLFYFNNNSKSLRFIYYNNMLEDECNYGIIDMNKQYETVVDETATEYSFDTVVLAMYNTAEEKFMYTRECNIGTVVKFPKTTLYNNLFLKSLISYSYDYNYLSTNILSSLIITEYANARGDSFKTKNYDKLSAFDFKNDKYTTLYNRVNPKTQIAEPYWNNNFNTYEDLTNELLNDNALIVNVDGQISRIPGGIIYISIPPNPQVENTKKTETGYTDLKLRYALLEGLWMISKVRHIISPSKNLYSLNLVLFKNYIEKQAENDIAFK